MYRLALITLLAAIGLVTSAHGESLTFEVYALESGDARTLLASGTKEYALSDVVVAERTIEGRKTWKKSVLVWSDFSVGASIYREPSLDGFGLWIDRPDHGFSWDWFVRENGDVYRKIQGGGRVRVTLAASKDYQELVAVEFLSDVTLRGRFSWWPFSMADTHQIVLKKGSILRIAP